MLEIDLTSKLLRHVPLSSGMLLKSFILDSLKIKVAPHPIIVSLDTLRKRITHILDQLEIYHNRPANHPSDEMRTEEETIAPAPQPEKKMRNWTEKTLSQAKPMSFLVFFIVLKSALNYDEWTTLLTTGGWKFLRKARTKKKALLKCIVASTAPLLHPQSKNLPQRTTQRQQRQFKKKKKKKEEEATFFESFQYEIERSAVKIDLGWPSHCR